MDTREGTSRGRGRGRGRFYDHDRGGGYDRNFDRGYNNQGGGYDRGYDNRRGRGRNTWGGRHQSTYQGGSGYSSRGRGRGGGRGGGDSDYTDYQPHDMEYHSRIQAHEQAVTGLVANLQEGRMFSGSADGYVQCWDTATGQKLDVFEIGGEVDSLLREGPFLFVGAHQHSQGNILCANLHTHKNQVLTGHQGAVNALCVGVGNYLFSGGEDTTIRVWMYDAASTDFQLQAALDAAHSGHTAGVTQLITCSIASAPILISSDSQGNLKVWDLSSGSHVQTLPHAHTSSITAMLHWHDNGDFLFTGGEDGYVKVWQLQAPAAPAGPLSPPTIVVPTPIFTQPVLDTTSFGKVKDRYGPVLAMCMSTDASGSPVLMVSHASDRVVRLWDIPTFADRGQLKKVNEARALTSSTATTPGSTMVLAGENNGGIKIWKWKL